MQHFKASSTCHVTDISDPGLEAEDWGMNDEWMEPILSCLQLYQMTCYAWQSSLFSFQHFKAYPFTCVIPWHHTHWQHGALTSLLPAFEYFVPVCKYNWKIQHKQVCLCSPCQGIQTSNHLAFFDRVLCLQPRGKNMARKMWQSTCELLTSWNCICAPMQFLTGNVWVLWPSPVKLFGSRRTKQSEVIKKQNGVSHLIDTEPDRANRKGEREVWTAKERRG